MIDAGQTLAGCSNCGHINAPGTLTCAKCSTALGLTEGTTLQDAGALDAGLRVRPRFLDGVQTPLPGTVLAERYEIIDTLGAGGMGAVYKVWDRRLTRVVALKTIHPQLAANPMMMKRFKQEILLAQKIVHKNVVRIFDIGEDQGMNFITMDFIEGVSLKDVIQTRGKLPPSEAVRMIREVCHALEAAHGEGVVHRDLKPQNIMIDKDQHVVVMDFGIARGADSSTTQTGALLGTPDYMSPEQARMEEVDARSDIFSLGLIFHELLTGKLAFADCKTVVETLFIRTKERAVPPAEIDHNIPKAANDIVVKCLEPDRERRYQSVTEIVHDLETFDPSRKAGAAALVKGRLRKASRYRNLAATFGLVVVALLVGFLLRNRFAPAPPVAHAPMTVFIADFNNHTGDSVFDSTLEPVVKLALEGAGFINAYDRRQVANLGLPPVAGRLDETEARKIAVGQGLGFVVSGSLDQNGDGYVVSIKATEAVTGNMIGSAEEQASSKEQVLYATAKLAGTVRTALGDETSDSTQRFAMETLTATSLEAIHEYATAMDALSSGKHGDALKNFISAVDVDPNFGLAYAGMAVASRNLGQQQDAEKYIKLALERIDRMTEREKYRTRAYYYSLFGNRQKCVEEYGTLINRFPSDAAAHNNLANCLTQLRDIPKAIEVIRQAMAILPKRALYRNNLALYSSYASDFPTAEREARTAQEMNPSYTTNFVANAFAQLGQGQVTQARETYQKLGQIDGSFAQTGLGDVALYEGRFADAARIFEQGAAADLTAKYPDRAAVKFVGLAYTRLLQAQNQQAIAAAEKAIANSQAIKIRSLSGLIFAAAGQELRAAEVATALSKELQPEPQAYAKLIQGKVEMQSGDPRAAIKSFTEANNLLDTWIGRFELGKAYLEVGAFPEADSEFDRCIRRRGEALALFLDESPTFGYFPGVYYYMGRAREGMNSAGFAEFYRTYLSIRGEAREDPLLADVLKRVGSRS
jgi:eukaryotic-like serine/threonine-protein kinase